MITKDLQANRCPNAQIALNAVLQAFANSSEDGLIIRSIEPSLQRALQMRIEHLELPLRLVCVEKELITSGMRNEWGQHFDQEDFEDVTTQFSFILQRITLAED